ncbi:MAG: 4Fe-4S dicluster domain-containing protein [Candidatus Lokiarchaeota archaeon]|nr:4Fe-4S dicluster domain-containing protein [Candidatus Lokiarchaeota archaeon]
MKGRRGRRSGRRRNRRPRRLSRIGVQRAAYPSRTVVQTRTDSTQIQEPTVDTSKCVGCGICAENCPTGAISIVNGKAQIDYSKCENCGVCIKVCSQNAIS